MSDILLCTLNARYIHASFGLRYLKANLGELAQQCEIMEFTIKQNPADMVERILRAKPKIVGFGVYIWNVAQTTPVVAMLKRLIPQTAIVLGGPEVSYETDQHELVGMADAVITGEADLAFPELCRDLLAGSPPAQKIIKPSPPDMASVTMPYHLYDDHDLQHRILYVEASRGCPFTCEFCLSSLEIPVRGPALADFLAEVDELITRGARHLKFVDRTFNLNIRTSKAILNHFLEMDRDDLFLHFEMVPDRLPAPLMETIQRFPNGRLQFEVGVQTFNPTVAAHISLRRNYDKLSENLKFLMTQTGVHLHADLIAGLPGEDLASFAAGFDRLYALGPHEIQVGILKRLRGTPITRHEQPFELVFNPYPPYDILQTSLLSFEELQWMQRFSKLWDRVANSGMFTQTTTLLLSGDSPFYAFYDWTQWLWEQTGQAYGINLERMMKLLFTYLTQERGLSPERAAVPLAADYAKPGRTLPRFLKDHLAADLTPTESSSGGHGPLKRQQRTAQAG